MAPRRAVSIALATALLAVGLTFGSLGLDPPAEAAASTTFQPVADATVDAATPLVALGTTASLAADGSPQRISYLRFAVSGLTSPVGSARLRVHVQNTAGGPSPASGAVTTVSSTTWPETTMTWATRAALGGQVAVRPGPAAANSWVEYDVTAAVAGNGLVSLAITQTDWDGLFFDSREGGAATAPQLVIDSAAAPPSAPSAPPFDIAVFGDVPYSTSAMARYDAMIRGINTGSTSFSVHLGDIGTHFTACTPAAVDREVARFDTFQRPLVYTPGDNEWTDCGSAQLSQLAYLRARAFRGTGTRSRGQTTLALESQAAAGYPENARWSNGPVSFSTLHVVGSSDNYANRSEHDARQAATITWLRTTFARAKARGDRGVVLLAQADPTFAAPTAAYRAIYDAVRTEALGFTGQVLYIHGDGHAFKTDRPLAGVTNLRRVEVEGDSLVSYVKIRVDPSSTALFTITPPIRY